MPPLDRHFRLEPRCHPYVLSSKVASNDFERRRVKFYDLHMVVFYKHGKKLNEIPLQDPALIFTDAAYQDRFLGDIWDKNVQRFDIGTVWSHPLKGSKDKKGIKLSWEETLYFWLSRDGDISSNTISFYNCRDSRPKDNYRPHLEFRACWFSQDIWVSAKGIQLVFKGMEPKRKEQDDLATSPVERHFFPQFRRKSSHEKRSPQIERITSGDWSSTSPSLALSSPDSSAIGLDESPVALSARGRSRTLADENPPADVLSKFGPSLLIEFVSPQAMKRFKTAFAEAMTPKDTQFVGLGPPAIDPDSGPTPNIPPVRRHADLGAESEKDCT